MTNATPDTALATRLIELSVKSTQDPLNEDGRYFNGDWHNDLTQCSHGDTGNYSNRRDGQFIAALWNAFRDGQIITLAEHEAIIATCTPTAAPNAWAVKVKPLVWVELEQDRGDGTTDLTGKHEAETCVGTYETELSFGSDSYYWSVARDGDEIGHSFEDLAYAKAAAQSDYAARILSAIDVHPDPRDAQIAVLVGAIENIRVTYLLPPSFQLPLDLAIAAVKGENK